jgi:carbonic anhydrase/acetyltransferase-like protein (isoleucine patch superfamily)
MAIYEFEGKTPEIGKDSFVHPEATLIGEVIIGKNCFIGPGVRLRADWCRIEIADNSNIQDNCIIHAPPNITVSLGKRSHIAHGAILHGVKLHEHVLVGMGAVVLDSAEIGDDCVINSGCVVPPGMKVPPKKIVKGIPGKIAGDVSPEMGELWNVATEFYIGLSKRYHDTLKEI